MAFKVSFEFPNQPSHAGSLEVIDFSVEESASPLAASDSSGSVGTFSVTFPEPDPYLVPLRDTPWSLVQQFGPQFLVGSKIRIFDSRKGFTLGTVDSASAAQGQGTLTVSGLSRLGDLNAYGIQAQPFVGTLEGAFEYYLSLAGISTDIFVDASIGNRPVVLPGWHGELWYHLKQMAAAESADISLVSGVILLRPVRQRIATSGRDTARAIATGGTTLAQSIEIYQYNNRSIGLELVYPPGGWTPETEVLNVNAGEEAEYTLELSASLTSIEPLEIRTFVPASNEITFSKSVVTVVADDGLPVSEQAWIDYGGKIELSIAPDTTHLEVRLTGPVGLPTATGEEARNFSLALASDTSGNRYSTLRVIGTGVGFTKEKKVIRTGITAPQSATEVGVTIDNPFLSTPDQVYSAGTRAARQFAGVQMSLTADVTAINRRGDTGHATYPKYSTVLYGVSPRTYGQVQTLYGSEGLSTYSQVRDYWLAQVQDDDIDQVFGNVQGARIYDRKTRRWYRIRQGRSTPAGINISQADDDLLYDDKEALFGGLTYGQVEALRAGMTYLQDELVGLYNG